MGAIAEALQDIHRRIDDALAAAGRPATATRLLAVSKTFPAEAIRAAHAAGQTAFGESYVQEALAKIAQLAEHELEWHFIGPIQSNKTRPIAEHFAWVHSVDRFKIAERLSAARPAELPPLNVCLQVNIGGEASKGGAMPAEAIALAARIAALPGLKLRGFMTIPRPTEDRAAQRAQFRQLRVLFEQARAAGLAIDTLSMGMSDDLEAAIMEGATIVRVGSAIFGARSKTTTEGQP